MKTFFDRHLKTRNVQTFVIHESDRSRGKLWAPEVKTFFSGRHLTFQKLLIRASMGHKRSRIWLFQ